MNFNKIIKFFLPRDKVFFALFKEILENLEEMASLSVKGIEAVDSRQKIDILKKVVELEHKNDSLVHRIFVELGENFITPFDREDIQDLAMTLDDIADYQHFTAKKIMLYKFYEADETMMDLSRLIYKSVVALKSAFFELENKVESEKVKQFCIEVNRLENEADEVYEKALAHLFEFEENLRRVIVLKDILESQEIATDKCEGVANIIQSILIKYA